MVRAGTWSIDLPKEYMYFGVDNPELKLWRKFTRTCAEEMKSIDEKDMTFSNLSEDAFRVLSTTGDYSCCECRSTRETFYCNDSCLWVDYCWYCNQFGCCKMISAHKASLNAIVSRYLTAVECITPLPLDSLESIRDPLREMMDTVNVWTIHDGGLPRY